MGLGKIGLPVATYVSKYFEVTGYDINEAAISIALEKKIRASNKLSFADVYVIVVNTYYKENSPDMSAVGSCCSKISQINANALVCFESTLSVGTARKMSLDYNLKYVIVCPHRWWEEDQVNHGVKQLRVIGAINDQSMQKATAFYDSLQIPLHRVSSLELAEATKVAENAHRYVQIAFAEELKLVADKNGFDFEEWREAMNTKWNVNLPEARKGIGKECLPKDTLFLTELDGKAFLVTGAIKANTRYVKHIERIKKEKAAKLKLKV